MKKRLEIENRISELTPKLELAEESYFSLLKDKQSGKEVSKVDFLKAESEYEILKKEVETLDWVIDKKCTIILGDFGKILLDKHSKEVYEAIKEKYDENGKVVISFKGVATFQTTFARDTFGKIYNEIGRKKYNMLVDFEDVTSTHMLLIREGILKMINA